MSGFMTKRDKVLRHFERHGNKAASAAKQLHVDGDKRRAAVFEKAATDAAKFARMAKADWRRNDKAIRAKRESEKAT